jgi:hypothetical protein
MSGEKCECKSRTGTLKASPFRLVVPLDYFFFFAVFLAGFLAAFFAAFLVAMFTILPSVCNTFLQLEFV